MNKFNEWWKKIRQKKTKAEMPKNEHDFTKDLNAPNKVLQPFSHLQWKVMGIVVNEREERLRINKKVKGISEFFYRFGKSWTGLLGLFILVVLIFCSLIIPFTAVDPNLADPNNNYAQVFTAGHIFGTDNLGRDIWSRIWTGLNFSINLSIMATLIDVVIGVTIGIIMGYSKKFDSVMQWIIKVITNIPVIIIMILATLVFKPSFWVLVGSLTITGWVGMANQIRAQVKRAKTFLWVTASRILGTPSRKIIYNFLPTIIPILITQLIFTIPGAILAEASLAFIGLSIPGAATLGNMISEGSTYITLYPRLTLLPSFFLVLIPISVQFIGNATQSALKRQR